VQNLTATVATVLTVKVAAIQQVLAALVLTVSNWLKQNVQLTAANGLAIIQRVVLTLVVHPQLAMQMSTTMVLSTLVMFLR
jgi:hypothetical protein